MFKWQCQWVGQEYKNRRKKELFELLYLKYWVIIYTCQVKTEKQKEEKQDWQS